MKKKLVSLLSLILAVVMICPTMVFAEEPFAISVNGEDESSYTIYTNSAKNKVDLDVPSEYTNVGWGSDDPSIATVDSNGVVEAKSAGTVTITATNNSNREQTDSCTITVEARAYTFKSKDDSKVKKDYIMGEKFNPANLSVVVTYNDTGDQTLTSFTLKDDVSLKMGDTEVWVVAENGYEVKIAGITVTAKEVTKVEVIDANRNYTEGDSISGIKLKVSYNDNTSIEMTSGFDVSINRPLTVADNNATVSVSYGEKSATFTIKVAAASGSGSGSGSGTGTGSGDTSNTTKYTAEITKGAPKKTYHVGDTIDLSGITEITLKKDGSPIGTLKGSQIASAVVFNTTGTDVKVTVSFSYDAEADGVKEDYSLEITGITVTEKTDDRHLKDISYVYLNDDAFNVGDILSHDDIRKIKVKFVDGDEEVIYGEDLDEYDFADNLSLEVLAISSSGTTSRKTSSSKRSLIEEANVFTKDGKKYVNLAVYYNQYSSVNDTSASTVSFTEDLTVEIEEPEIAYYYDKKLIATYDDLEDALDYTLGDDKNWKDFELRDVDDDEEVTLKLGKDFSITSSSYDYSPEKVSVIIDLNGYDLTLRSDTIVVVKADKDNKVTITNSSKTESTFKYSDKGITLTLGEGDSITFEYSTDDDYLPGIVTVSVTVGANGKVTATPALSSGKATVGMGSDVKFTITPNSGYEVEAVKVDSKAVATTNNSNYSVASTGVVTYTLADVEKDTKVEVTFVQTKPEWKNPFTDVKSSSSYYEAVEFVYTHELFNGMTNTTFGPDVNMNRAMFVTVLGRLSGLDLTEAEAKYGQKSSFPDITVTSDTKWYVPYIEWAVSNGIVVGRDNGQFDPYAYITKQEMYVMMYRYAVYVEHKQVNLNGVNLTASDRSDVKDWAIDEVKYAHQQDYLVLSGSKIEPEKYAVRWELATLLQKFSVNVLGWAE